ncbi:hypothetical protein D1AOALGA4SA_7232 [Olavius algarvensis Delta 1 endosymbiont]|nr:hypothetical protein D1AOALGA4SA_7232 [Olavius algarvensis Delta 1 endosymbiont]
MHYILNFGIRRPASGHQYRVSSIEHPISSIQYPASRKPFLSPVHRNINIFALI